MTRLNATAEVCLTDPATSAAGWLTLTSRARRPILDGDHTDPAVDLGAVQRDGKHGLACDRGAGHVNLLSLSVTTALGRSATC